MNEVSSNVRLNFDLQYQKIVATLHDLGILHSLVGGHIGITGIDGREYPLPEYDLLIREISKSWEWLNIKMNQGFCELLFVPIALPLSTFFEILERQIIKHGKANGIFMSAKQSTYLRVDLNNCFYRWDNWQDADIEGRLFYYPRSYKADSGGMTKKELLGKQKKSPFHGWIVALKESVEIPGEEIGEMQCARKQFEANYTPYEYLNFFSYPEYDHEEGLTIEGWIMEFFMRLHEKNVVIDDWNGNEKLSYLLGNFDPNYFVLPFAGWQRPARQAFIGRIYPCFQNMFIGARSVVRIA